MKKTILFAISALLMAFVLGCDNSIEEPPPPAQVETTEEIFCIEVFAPVCGMIEIDCEDPPCEKVPQTFSNRCYAEKAGAIEIYDGECESDS